MDDFPYLASLCLRNNLNTWDQYCIMPAPFRNQTTELVIQANGWESVFLYAARKKKKKDVVWHS